MLLRDARAADLTRVAEIYNMGIAERVATFETRPREPAELTAWLQDGRPFLVAEEDGRVLGFARAGEYSTRPAYDGVAEHTVYVDAAARGRAIGRRLLDALVEAAERAGLHKLTSRIFADNAASRAAHRAAGFTEVGVHVRHARLDGTWKDCVVVERLLGDAAAPAAAPAVTLRPATAADLPWLEALAGDALVAPFLARGAQDGLAEALADADAELLVAEHDGRPVGAVCTVATVRRMGLSSLRWLMVDPGARGRGLGVGIVRAAATRLLDEQGGHRVEAEVYGFNDAGVRTFRAAGFREEGVRRAAWERDGAWRDGVRFGLVAGDPR